MAEGEDAGKSEQQVVRTREQCEAQDLRQKDRVKIEGGDAGAGKRNGIRQIAHPPYLFPNRPAGVVSSTIAMMTKITRLAPCGRSEERRVGKGGVSTFRARGSP